MATKKFRFSKEIDLDALISSTISQLCVPDNPDAAKFDADLSQIQAQVKSVERKQQQINRALNECQSQIDTFQEELEEVEREDELKYQEASEAAAEAAKQPSEITIVDTSDDNVDDSGDDDVQFIQKTYEPKTGSSLLPERRTSKSPSHQTVNGTQPTQSKVSTLDSLRAALAASIKKQLPNPTVSTVSMTTPGSTTVAPHQPQQVQQAKPVTLVSGSPTAPPPLQRRPVSAGVNPVTSYINSSAAIQERMEKAFLEDVKRIAIGDLILGRKYNDVWEKATVTEIMNADHGEVSQRKYRLRFESKKVSKMMSLKQVAFFDSINKPVTVGTRIVALYKDDETDESFYAGIIAEAPSGRNELRYLVFFDDGYAQYCGSREIHKVFTQSKNVWEDIHPDSQDFIKDYLAQYPERPMVRLHKGQTVKTEWKGSWWTAKVIEVDASLVQMYFAADKRSEWIYRGSTRLEPLYTALANAEANRNAGKGKRHNLIMAGAKKPVVEYTRNNSEDAAKSGGGVKAQEKKKRAVARKSTTGRLVEEGSAVKWDVPWLKQDDKSPAPSERAAEKAKKQEAPKGERTSGGKGGKDIASVLQERLGVTEDTVRDEDAMGERCNQLLPIKDRAGKKFDNHNCGPACLSAEEEEQGKFKGNNPLLVPIFCGWERLVSRTRPYGRRSVFYRAPCSRRFRNMEELDKYLLLTDSKLPIDHFCFDSELHVHYEFIPVKTFCDIKDISYGKENVAISCVNGIDRQYPDYVDYSNQRIPASGVKLNVDPEFLVGCDCTDGCRDKSKCACQQLTQQASAMINGGKTEDVGYQHRRLKEPLLSGIYECNPRCRCSSRCVNRVVQNGLKNRLQVFKTEKRGWGLRCLDDIPKGGFICIYAGQLLTDQGANEDGQQYGDEYLAELDYIEVVERQKEGYESDVESLSEEEEEEEESEEEREAASNSSDSSYSGKNEPLPEKSHSTRSKRLRKSNEKKTADWVKDVRAGSAGDPDDLPDLDVPPPPNNTTKTSGTKTSGGAEEDVKGRKRTGRSTGARYGNLTPGKRQKDKEDDETSSSDKGPGTRSFYQDEQSCYIMDAKSMGNIGRYLNHSCTPNAFVQNVFVDTHDLRFPWVAFFAGMYISAGTELTWDYNYEVGSVPGKVLYCYCGSADCRGRLL